MEQQRFNYQLFIDDERYPTTPDWLIARTSYDAIHFVTQFGWPSQIAFDHDLGGQDTSRVFIRKLFEMIENGELPLVPHSFTYTIHSQNPIGAKNIQLDMDDLIQYYGEK